jgi:hypothetical protein
LALLAPHFSRLIYYYILFIKPPLAAPKQDHDKPF